MLVHQNDHPHKNHYLYRDTEGSGEWFFLPWDHDLTIGSNWVGTSFSDTIYADDDSVPGRNANVQPSHPFIGAEAHREWNNHWNRFIDKLVNHPIVREMYLRRLRSTMDQVLQQDNVAEADRWFESRLNNYELTVGPDANLDYDQWANPWRWGSDQSFVDALNVIRDDYLVRRREHLYVTHHVDSANPNRAGIPDAQSADVMIEIQDVVFNPVSGNQDEEYIRIQNLTDAAVDISGWSLNGGVDYEFRAGVVIPEGGTLYVSPNVRAFRARATGPSGGQGLFVQGNYEGHLSNFGEQIELIDASGTVVQTFEYEGMPSPQQEQLRITEINYHPHEPTPAELAQLPQVEKNDFEFIEVMNTGATAVNLAGVNFSSGITFTFGDLSLAAGERTVVVANQAAFELRYGNQLPVAGEFASGALSNDGEGVKLDDASNSTIQDFNYNDGASWPQLADGKGASLEVVDTTADYDSATNWRNSREYSGTPGAAGSGPVVSVVINEVLSHTDPPQLDTIELYNPTNEDLDVGNWFLSDSCNVYRKFQFPAGTIIPAQGYLTLSEDDFNASMGQDPLDFALNGAHGDELFLLSATAAGDLLDFIDFVEFGAAFNGQSLGRWPNGTGEFVPQIAPTLNQANSGPSVGPVLISEVHYNPLDPGPGFNADDLEFVEIYNGSADPVNFTNWRLQGGIDYQFPNGLTLASGELIVLVSFDPTDDALLTEFSNQLSFQPANNIYGPYSGRLANGGDIVQLMRPDTPPLDEPDFIPLIVEDEVRYGDSDPWPVEPDGTGSSLTRQGIPAVSAEWGMAVSSWVAADPTPAAFAADGAPQLVSFTLNGDQVDPDDLPGQGQQPSSWANQRSQILSIQLAFTQSVVATAADFQLTNLGVNAPVDADTTVALANNHVTVAGNIVSLNFAAGELEDGVYRLDVAASLTSVGGTPVVPFHVEGSEENRFYQLTADYNGDTGVSIFDFAAFAYWFGTTSPPAAGYLDLNGDGGISIFDFATFAEQFERAIVYPPVARSSEPAALDADDAIEEANWQRLETELSDLWGPLSRLKRRDFNPEARGAR